MITNSKLLRKTDLSTALARIYQSYDLTQKQLAVILDISRSALSARIRHSIPLTSDELDTLLNYLKKNDHLMLINGIAVHDVANKLAARENLIRQARISYAEDDQERFGNAAV